MMSRFLPLLPLRCACVALLAYFLVKKVFE